MSVLNENDSLETLELAESVVGKSSVGLLTKSIRVLLATAVLGSVAAYGAISAKPELVDYLSFIPGMETTASHCSGGACGASSSCGAAASCASACSTACGSESGSYSSACSTEEMTSCPALTGAVSAEASAEVNAEQVGSAEQL